MELAVDLKKVSYGNVFLRILTLLIVKPFTLPFQIFTNSLASLANVEDEMSEDKVLSGVFPLYVWLISLYDAFIVLCYPIGVIVAFVALFSAYNFSSGFTTFVGILIGAYFLPLGLGILREMASIVLKVLLYLKIISEK